MNTKEATSGAITVAKRQTIYSILGIGGKMKKWDLGDTLHRSVKLALDSGEATTLEDAQKMFESYRLAIELGPDVGSSPTLQAILLTAVNTGRRCFLGGVQVAGPVEADLMISWKKCKTLRHAIRDLHGTVVRELAPSIPRIIIGDVPNPANIGDFAVRATFNGWAGGVIPIDEGGVLPEKQEFSPAGVFAGATAVAEAFQFIRGGNALAGRRSMGLSLWRPDRAASWLDDSNIGPHIERLPSKLWLIGLGHLGQAFLWTLGLLPYANPESLCLVLQDDDELVPANESTSLLTFAPMLGTKKTRAMAKWCGERGFRTIICERRFNANFMVADDEPKVALCGVDNPMARSVVENVGFSRIIEAGLGKGTDEYLAFQMHTFPGPQKAREKWGYKEIGQSDLGTESRQPAYRALSHEGVDECGLTLLAGRSVGAPFVGAVTSAIVISEVLRMLCGGHQYGVIDGSLHSLAYRQAHINDRLTLFNPGFTMQKI